MKMFFKKFSALFLVAVMAFAGVDILHVQAATTDGACGESLVWSFDSSAGTLDISGVGDMSDYLVSGAPWFSFRSEIKAVNISAGVTSVGDNAFYDCDSLEDVSLPDGVTSVGAGAFGDCDALDTISLPNSLTAIGSEAFYACGLSSITVPESVTDIGADAFGWCSNLEAITVSDKNAVFSSDEYGVLFNKDKTELIKYPNNCKQTSYAVPDTVEALSDNSFENCNNLQSVTVPESVSVIGNGVFFNCSLENITVDENNAFYSSDASGVLFDKDKTTLLLYPACGKLTTYTVPDGVTTIAAEAFHGCTALKSLIISDGVTDIGDYALLFCDSLEYVHIPASVVNIGEEIIGGTEAYICSETADCSAAEYADENGYTFALCESHGVLSVTLSQTKIEIENKQTYALEAVVSPETAADKTVIWSTNAPAVATVDENGVVTAVSPGTAEITASSGGKSATCKVTVNPRMFNVTWVVDGSETVVSVAEGAAVSDPVSPEKQGHSFAGWTPEIPPVMPANNIKFTAVWTTEGYKSVFDANGGKWSDGAKIKNIYTLYGDTIELPDAPERVGYSFVEWSPVLPEAMPDEELLFTAVWSANSYDAVFNANGGKWADGADEITVPTLYDSEIAVPDAPSKQGYAFNGWTPEVGVMDSVFGLEFTAQWVALTDTPYTVITYTMGTDGKYTEESQALAAETDSTVEAQYTVETGFSLNDEKSVLSGVVAADGSLVLKVYFDRIKSRIVINGVAGEYFYGEEIAEPSRPDAPKGHVQNGWVDENGNPVEFPLVLDENFPAEINPSFVKQSYTVVWNVDGATVSETYKYEQEIVAPADPEKAGYRFVGWTPEIPDAMPDGNLEFFAVFEKIFYTCPDCLEKFDDEAEFNAHIAYEQSKKAVRILIKNNPGTATINYGETLILTAVPTDDIPDTKIYWYVDGEQQGEGETFRITFNGGEKTVTVKMVDFDGNALTDENGNEISDGQKVKVKAGLWQKIVSFFKNLFRMNRTVTQSVL